MKSFINIVSQHITSEDPIVRDFIGFHLKSFPFTPAELVNEQLKFALDADERTKTSILINGNYRCVDEETLHILLELVEKLPNSKQHLIIQFLQKLPISIIVNQHEKLKRYLHPDFIAFCNQCLEANEQELWEIYSTILGKLEEQRYVDSSFQLAKKVQDVLIDKGYFDEKVVQPILEKELKDDWLSYDGIFAVRAIGLLQLTEYIPTLASFLSRYEDILVEETYVALSRFQSDEVVQAVAPYAKDHDSYHFAIAVLKEIKTELSGQILEESYDVLGVDGKEIVIDALTSHFSERAFPLIDDFIANNYRGGVFDMEEIFYGFYKVMGQDHPELSNWRKVWIERMEHMEQLEKNPMKFPFVTKENSTTPVKSEKIGRNDPCPCGSGKKYKKCCG